MRSSRPLAIAEMRAALRAGASEIEAVRRGAQLLTDPEKRGMTLAMDLIQMGLPVRDAFSVNSTEFAGRLTLLFDRAAGAGALLSGLDSLAKRLTLEDKRQRNALQALLYPASIAVIGLFGAISAMVVVVPEMAKAVTVAGGTIPPATAALISISDLIVERWPALVLLSLLSLFWLMRSRARLVGLLTGLPALKRITELSAWASVGSSLAAGAEAGAGMPETLLRTTDRFALPYIGRLCQRAGKLMSMGFHAADSCAGFPEDISASLESTRHEQAPRLHEVAENMVWRYESSMTNLVSMLQPALTLLVSIVVGLISVIICLPALTPVNLP